MSRIAYVNGQYEPMGAASVHIEDRHYRSDGKPGTIARRLRDEFHLFAEAMQ